MEPIAEIDATERLAVDRFIVNNGSEVRAVCEALGAGTDYEYGALAFAYALGRTRVTSPAEGRA